MRHSTQTFLSALFTLLLLASQTDAQDRYSAAPHAEPSTRNGSARRAATTRSGTDPLRNGGSQWDMPFPTDPIPALPIDANPRARRADLTTDGRRSSVRATQFQEGRPEGSDSYGSSSDPYANPRTPRTWPVEDRRTDTGNPSYRSASTPDTASNGNTQYLPPNAAPTRRESYAGYGRDPAPNGSFTSTTDPRERSVSPPDESPYRTSQSNVYRDREVSPSADLPLDAYRAPTEEDSPFGSDRTTRPPIDSTRNPQDLTADPRGSDPRGAYVDRQYATGVNAAMDPGQSSATPGNARGYDNEPKAYPLTMLLLFASLGLNAYLFWIALDTYNRYQDLVGDMRSSRNKRERSEGDYVERLPESAGF